MKIIWLILLFGAQIFAQEKEKIRGEANIFLLEKDSTKLSQSRDSTDFRKARWGMSKIKAKKSETAKLYSEEKDIIIYQSKVAGLDCMIGYVFADDKLVRGRYVFILQHTNKNDFIDDYKSIKETISEKYGTPKQDETVWKNLLYADDIEKYGFAVSMGHLYYYAAWETPTTEIDLELSGDNFEIKLLVEYTSIKLKSLAERAKKNKKSSDF